MKLKKILAGAMAGAMVLGSVVGVSASTTTVTNENWWDAWTPTYEIKDGANIAFDATITAGGPRVFNSLNAAFVNVATDGINSPSADNFTDYTEYVVLRSDNYGWGTYYSTTTYTGTDYLYMGVSTVDTDDDGNAGTIDYATLLTGATYVINITRDGTTINYDYVITLSDDTVLNCGYEIVIADLADSDSAYVFFTGDAGVTFSITERDVESSVNSVALVAGNTSALSGVLTFYDTASGVTYTSSDTDVATVDESGVITGVAAGTTTITVASANNSVAIAVTVTDKENPITGVTATASSSELTVGGTATITPAYTIDTTIADATTDGYAYTYTSSDTSVLTVDENGTVTAVAAGSATVTVTVTATHLDESTDDYTTTIDFTVTEAASEDADTETEAESTEEDTETEEVSYTTVVKTVELDDLTAEGFWTVFSEGLELVEGQQIVITGTTTNNSTNSWDNALFVLYSSDDAAIYGAGTDEATAANYIEYFVGRLDNYGWGTATYEVTAEPDDWDAWLAATQAGAEFTITVTYVNGTIQIVSSCEGAEYVVTYAVEDDSLTYYVALTGEECELTNLVATYYEADEESIVETTETEAETETESSTTTTTTTTTTTSSTGDADTGDASPIIPIAVAMLGCAAVVIAGKKRMA